MAKLNSLNGSVSPLPNRPLLRLWARLVHVNAPDPLRRMLNRALAPIYVLYTVLALLVAPTYAEPWRQMFAAGTGLACLVGLYYNRRDVRGPVLLTICCAVGLTALVPLDAYFPGRNASFSLPGELLLPIIVAALFVSPRAGFFACGGMLALIAVGGLVTGKPPSSIASFFVVGGSTLLAVTGLLVVGASKFTQALRRSYEANVELERRVAERTVALKAANDELAEAKTRIEITAELRVKEITEVVHDARNQLAHVRAATGLLGMTDGPGDPADIERLHRTIDGALRAQQDMLDSLLEATLLDAGSLRLHPERTSLAELVELATAQARPAYEQRGCALVVEPPEALPAVICDARRMLRVVHNLLNNALSYTAAYRPVGGVVRVSIGREDDQAVLRVEDNGVGIPPDQLPLVGQRFVRGVRGGGAPDGTGLGLSASMGIVALHGGQLRLLSEGIGLGTTAEVRLPIAQPAVSRDVV